MRLIAIVYISALVLAVACSSPAPSPSIYEDILLSCSSVSPELEEKSRNFFETGGRVECHGGEKQSTKDSPAGGGRNPRALNFGMFVTTHERPPTSHISNMKGQIGHRDNIKVIRTPNLPWDPPEVVDDYVRVEYRDKVSLKTGKPEVSYSIHAVVGNTLFGVDTTDYAAYIGPENIPVGRAMWGEAQRTVELLIARYLALQPKTSAKVVQATKITSSTSQYVITSAPWPTRPPTARPTATSTPIPVPSSPTYWIASGDTHAEAGLYRTAIKDYDIAIQLAPDHAEAYYKRGLAYFNNLQYGEAISDYEKTIQLDPTYAKAYNKQGRVSEKSGKYQAAIKQYDIAIQLAPDYAEAYYNRGDVYAWLGEDERAKADLDRACSLDKQYC